MKRFSATHRATGLKLTSSMAFPDRIYIHVIPYGKYVSMGGIPGFIRYLESTAKKLRKLTKEKK